MGKNNEGKRVANRIETLLGVHQTPAGLPRFKADSKPYQKQIQYVSKATPVTTWIFRFSEPGYIVPEKKVLFPAPSQIDRLSQG